jgi:hypothetical protein
MDPKEGKRIVDPDALRRARARGDECAACGRPGANAHHVLQRGAPHFGDDVVENLLLLCGSGTMLCHGAWHGSPYVHVYRGSHVREERRDRVWVAARVGAFILRQRPDTILYVIEKLRLTAALIFLEAEYLIDPAAAQRVWSQARERDLGLAP